ncbi:hypothetical protein ACFY93_09230 [Streptomyces sp. NPDC008313]|uniref:hypothetical protein n=1 Tax=Streptomyces sp. NPDC008313 TaxID=3364826 RepID=UPI0036EC6B7F
MPALPARRIASSALCATFLLGIAAPVAIAADSDSARGRTHAAAPVPGADALMAQVQSLADAGGVLIPVSDLLSAVLKADDGKLAAAEAQQYAQAVKDAIAKVQASDGAVPPTEATAPAAEATPANPATPAAPEAQANQATPATPAAPEAQANQAAPATPADPTSAQPAAPAAPAAPVAQSAEAKAQPAEATTMDEALSSLQDAVDELVEAITSGASEQVAQEVDDVMTAAVDVVSTTVAGDAAEQGTATTPSTATTPGAATTPSTVTTSPGTVTTLPALIPAAPSAS